MELDIDKLVHKAIKPGKLECFACLKQHEVASQTYHTIAGNIYVGSDGGLVGNNFNDDGTLNRVSIICRARDCVLVAFNMKGW